jgi:hypothetical protein
MPKELHKRLAEIAEKNHLQSKNKESYTRGAMSKIAEASRKAALKKVFG